MIFLHLLLGLIFGKLIGHPILFVFASILPDIDHLYLLVRHKLWRRGQLTEKIRDEGKYGLRFKTPLIHSVFGLVVCSAIFLAIFGNVSLAGYFALGYFLHLLLDWPDRDKKQFLYPFKIEFKGFLPIWSNIEKIVTILAVLFVVILFFF